jgi:hypothetical protein
MKLFELKAVLRLERYSSALPVMLRIALNQGGDDFKRVTSPERRCFFQQQREYP